MESLKSLLQHAAEIDRRAVEADRQGQIQNLKDLLEVLEKGEVETAIQWTRAALRLQGEKCKEIIIKSQTQ